MEQKTQPHPINLNLTIEPGSLKKVVEQGRLEEFVDTLSALAGAHIRAAIVTQVAKGASGTVTVRAGFDDDGTFGTGPHGPKGPWWPPHSGIYEAAMRQLEVNQTLERATAAQAQAGAVGPG